MLRGYICIAVFFGNGTTTTGELHSCMPFRCSSLLGCFCSLLILHLRFDAPPAFCSLLILHLRFDAPPAFCSLLILHLQLYNREPNSPLRGWSCQGGRNVTRIYMYRCFFWEWDHDDGRTALMHAFQMFIPAQVFLLPFDPPPAF